MARAEPVSRLLDRSLSGERVGGGEEEGRGGVHWGLMRKNGIWGGGGACRGSSHVPYLSQGGQLHWNPSHKPIAAEGTDGGKRGNQ